MQKYESSDQNKWEKKHYCAWPDMNNVTWLKKLKILTIFL